MRTSRTSSKKSSSLNGLSVRECLEQLTSSISLAKGTLAILSSKFQSPLISKSVTNLDPAHLPILLQDLTDEIWKLEETTLILNERLKNRYRGICLF
jgi:hypothetical protein